MSLLFQRRKHVVSYEEKIVSGAIVSLNKNPEKKPRPG